MNISSACADCLEEAGGRQQKHNISWQVDICPCCSKRAALTHPLNFGNPKLTATILNLSTPKESPYEPAA